MLSLSCFFLAGLLLAFLWPSRGEHNLWWWKTGVGIVIGGLVAGVGLWPGWLTMQRGMTALLMPIGLIWLGLIVLTIRAWRLKEPYLRWGSMAVLLLLTAGANRTVSKFAFDWLEGEYQRMNALELGNFDAVFVLGGGGGRGPEGQLNVSSSGDRVVLAARLYHAGKTKRLICTGKVASDYWPEDRDPGRLSFLLLQGLAVPETKMTRLGGRNTEEEMREIRSYLGTNVITTAGVVTSAWHMPRAMRLAGKEGLRLTPLPADFRGGEVNWKDFSIVPEGGALSEMGVALKELLARFAGR